MTQANPQYSTKIVAPVYEITGYMHDSILKMLDNFHQRVTLSPRHAWEARESVIVRVWNQLSGYMQYDNFPLTKPGTPMAMLIMWPEAYPHLMTREEQIRVMGPRCVASVRDMGPRDRVSVFQLNWDKLSFSEYRHAVAWNEDHAWSVFAYKMSGLPSRSLWYEVTNHWVPASAVDKSKGPPAYLNQFIILTHPRSS